MARVTSFRDVPNVQDQGTTSARVRAVDYGKDQVGGGIARFGQALGVVAQKADEIGDVQARLEANRLSIEHAKLAQQIGMRVKQTLGEGAYGAAEQGATDLQKGTDDILGQASPRARALLEGELTSRNITASDGYLEHGFGEQNKALLSSGNARRSAILEEAADEPDEKKAMGLLAPLNDINRSLASHFGYGSDWLAQQERNDASTFFTSRALKLGVGPNASASAVIEYATKYRRYLNDDDYQRLVSGYNDNALDELADHIIDGAPSPSATTAETPNQDGAPQRTLSARSFFDSFTVPHEGSTYVVDSNGAGVKYGVNEKYHPGVDVKNLTKDGAFKIFKAEYWNESGADKLPPAIAALHADTYYMNKTAAKRILNESGGDPDKYAALRTEFLGSLLTKNPAKYGRYEKSWTRRTKELKEFATRQGTDGTPLAVSPDDDLSTTKDAIMARTDIGSALKHKLVTRIEQRRSDARQERSIMESEAAGNLAMSAAQLGDNFTDVKQLPQDAWLKASPATRAQWITAARGNKEQKPLDPKVAAQIGFLQTFKPDSLADPHVLSDLSAKGVPQRVISQLAEYGGKARGTQAGAKADIVDRGTLESLAKDPFIAAGFDFWGTETSQKKKPKEYAAEVQDEANRRVTLMNYLQTEASSWALANPGKKADSGTMQKWIATSLIRVGQQGSARPFGSLNDHEVINAYGQSAYQSTVAILKNNGIDPTPGNVAQYMRRKFMLDHGLR